MLNQGWRIPEALTRECRAQAAATGTWPLADEHQLTLDVPQLAGNASTSLSLEVPNDARWLWFGTAFAYNGGEASIDQLCRMQIRFGVVETSRSLAKGRRGETPGIADSGFSNMTNVVGRITDPYFWAAPVAFDLADRLAVDLRNNSSETIPAGFLTFIGFKVYPS